MTDPCPCGAGPYDTCCRPYVEGEADAPTPVALMRSRYTATDQANAQYLVDTRHASTRNKRTVAEVEASCRARQLQGLTILEEADGDHPDEAYVEFRAEFLHEGSRGSVQERSRFLREDGRWYFVSSEFKPQPLGDDLA